MSLQCLFFWGDLRGVINLASWWLGKGSRTKDTPLGQENRCWMDNDGGYHEMNCLSSISLSCMFWRVQVAISQGSQCLPMVMLLVLTCLYSIEKDTLQCGKVGNVQLCLAHVPACSKYIPSKMNWPVIVVLHTWRLHVSVKYPYIYQQDQVIMGIHMKHFFGFWYADMGHKQHANPNNS